MGIHHAFGPGYAAVNNAGLNYASMVDAISNGNLSLLYVAGANPVFDDGYLEEALKAGNTTVIVTDLSLSETAAYADIVLPTQSIAERDGTFTSGMRRIQRFYPAIDIYGEALTDWQIAEMVGQALGTIEKSHMHESMVFSDIARNVPIYEGITYLKLAQVREQFPDVRGEGMYYGGTQYDNKNGLGVVWASAAEKGEAVSASTVDAGGSISANDSGLIVVPVTVLYDREPVFAKTELLHQRVPQPHVTLNPADADNLKITDGDMLGVTVNGHTVSVAAVIDKKTPQGVTLMPRRLQPQGAPNAAAGVPLTKLEKAEA